MSAWAVNASHSVLCKSNVCQIPGATGKGDLVSRLTLWVEPGFLARLAFPLALLQVRMRACVRVCVHWVLATLLQCDCI